jgi:hypothetical protein
MSPEAAILSAYSPVLLPAFSLSLFVVEMLWKIWKKVRHLPG